MNINHYNTYLIIYINTTNHQRLSSLWYVWTVLYSVWTVLYRYVWTISFLFNVWTVLYSVWTVLYSVWTVLYRYVWTISFFVQCLDRIDHPHRSSGPHRSSIIYGWAIFFVWTVVMPKLYHAITICRTRIFFYTMSRSRTSITTMPCLLHYVGSLGQFQSFRCGFIVII